MMFERSDRLRLLELAVECGAPPFEVVATAREFEAYMLGQEPPKRAPSEWSDFHAEETDKAH